MRKTQSYRYDRYGDNDKVLNIKDELELFNKWKKNYQVELKSINKY